MRRETAILGTQMRLLVVLVSAMSVTIGALAEGFRNPPASASGIGKVSGNTPHIDDASAIYINPANLSDLDEASVMVSASFGYAKFTFDPILGGGSEESRDPVALLPNIYSAVPVQDGDYVMGVGLTTPFGRFTKYDDDAIFRYSSPTFAKLGVVDIKPTIAKKIGDNLAIGVGADIYYSEIQFRQFVPWSMVTGVAAAPDGKAEYEADGYAIGGSAGITWQATERQRIAVTYKAPFDIDYEGDFDVNNVPASLAPLGITSSSDFDTEIKFPSQVAVGYGLQATDTVRIGLEVEWIENSRLQKIPVDIGNNNALLPSSSIPQEWDDTWTYGLGLDWQYSPSLVFRAGYIYLEAPSPDHTLFPTEAEDDQGALSVGLGYESGDHAIDLAYMIGLFDGDRKIRDNPDPTLNGDYEIESHFVSVAYSKRL